MASNVDARRFASAHRRDQLVAAAARLFAERGFHGVSIEEIGASVGISGPAVYKHFPSKDAVLAALLVGVSRDLLEEGRRRVADAPTPDDALERLLAFHADFTLARPELIRVQDRDLGNLSAGEARRVRRFQRAYVELWVEVLVRVEPSLDLDEARTRIHAVFGLLNSTPHSVPAHATGHARPILVTMARAAIRAGA
ncbi:MAG TPA: TetR/AcrR family transcriptional regulator [Acidimicrobiales bacterium]|nr:TetR/AcrR family transcriptional regulator [Acidimicrobiales bacterium]